LTGCVRSRQRPRLIKKKWLKRLRITTQPKPSFFQLNFGLHLSYLVLSIVRPKEKSEDPNDYSECNSTPRRPKLTVLNLDVNPLKTKMISIKGHKNYSVQNSHHSHDLTYQSFCKTHVSHGNVALSSITETNSRGLDAFIHKRIGLTTKACLFLVLKSREWTLKVRGDSTSCKRWLQTFSCSPQVRELAGWCLAV
jgi:hypothetical protein